MRILGFALFLALGASAAVAGNTAPSSLDVQKPLPATQPHWTAIHAKVFPGCVETGTFIPARIVVVPREGEARTTPYNEASVARIADSWNDYVPANDLYTIGRGPR